jgi:hypothetical protein
MREPEEPKPNPEKSREPEQPRKPTPEEQMEKFEEDLKENDWGHQPC